MDNFELPVGWVEIPLGRLITPSYGKALPGEERGPSLPIPVVASGGVISGTSKPLVSEPCIVVGRKGNIGGAQFFDSGCWPIDTTYFLRIPRNLNAKFLALQLSAQDWRKLDSSTATPSLRREDLEAIPITIPPLQEQNRIVEALESNISQLEAAMLAVTRAKRRLRPFTSSSLDRAVLGNLSIGSQDPAESDDSRRLLSGFSSKRFDYSVLPDLPPGWFWRRASDVCDFIASGSTPKTHLMHAGSGDIPFLKVYNILPGGGVDFTNKPTFIDKDMHNGQLKRSRVRPGDVLTNIVGPPLGKTATVPNTYPEWNINQAIVAFRAGPEVKPAWLALALQSPFVLGLLKGTAKATAGQFNIALSTCRELPLPIPPVETQITLIEECAGFLEMSSRLLSQISPISLRSKRLRQAIFRRAFSGKLVPQDPADEPASLVLAQLLAQRDAESRRPKRNERHLRDANTAKNVPPRLSTSSRIPPTAIQQELPF